MRILIHTINYRPEVTGVGKYTTEMCEWLAARGNQVTVIAPPPYYPQWRVAPPYHQWRYASSLEEGVRVRRAPIWIPKRPGGFSRIAYALSFALTSFPLLVSEALRKPDLVVVIQPSFLNSPGVWLAARFAGARAWLHVQDFEIDLAYDLGQLKKGKSLAAAVESWMVRRFDLVSAISARMLRRAQAKGADAGKLFLLPNWFDPSSIYPTREPSPFRARLSIPEGSPVALFSGSLGAKQGVEMIVQSAELLRGQDLHFVICGDGVAEPAIKAAAKGIANVHFLPLQPTSEFNALLNLADVHLLPQRQGADQSVFPSKLIGMLASGRPVVAMAGPGSEVAKLIEGCGVCVGHSNVDAFAAGIWRLIANREERLRMGGAARARAVHRFRQDVIFAGMEAEISIRSQAPSETSQARLLRRMNY